MIALLGLIVLGGATQTPIPPVSEISCAYNPQRIAKILPDLSKAMELKLGVDSSLADDTVMIDVAKAKPQELLSRLALVLCAKWVRQDSGCILVPDKARLSESGARELRERAKDIQKAVTLRQASLGPGSIEENAILSLLSLVGPDTLAGLSFDSRHVFTLKANARQKPLPVQSSEIVGKLIESEWRRKVADDPDLADSKAPEIGKALLVLQVFHASIQARLVVGATNANLVPNVTLYLTVHPAAHPPAPHGDPLPIGSLSKEFYTRAFQLSRAGGPLHPTAIGASASSGRGMVQFSAASSDSIEENLPISEELRRRLLQPSGVDPFWIVADPFDRAARLLKKANLVAFLPDYSFGTLAKALAMEKMDDLGFIQSVAPAAGLDVMQTPGWLTISPREQVYAIRSHVDRASLERFISLVGDSGVLSIRDIADYSLVQPTPMATDGIDDLYVHALNNEAWGRAYACLREPWLTRLYATLTPRQSSVLSARQQLVWGNLTPEQQEWAEYDFYNSQNDPLVNLVRSAGDSISFIQLSGPDGERTELMPGGLSDSAVLTMSAEQKPAFHATDSKSGASCLVTSNGLASQRYQRERPDLAFLGTPPNFDSFVPALSQTIRLEFKAVTTRAEGIAYTLTFRHQLSGDAILADARTLSYGDLPDSFRSDVEQQLKGMEESLADMIFGRTKQKTPPP